MKEMISYCGLSCHECPALLATKADDDEKRKEVAAIWSKQYGKEMDFKSINCNGCLTDGEVVFAHCQTCEIRACGKEKKVENCAHCDEYVCDKLDKFFAMAPMCKENLDAIRLCL
jgi:hypothetical protein